MANYVKFELEDGSVVYIETTDLPKGSSGLIPGGRGESAVHQESVSFEEAVTGVRKMAGSLLRNLRQGLAEEPEEVQINFGLKASADVGGLVVARGGMESNYNVMLRWRSEPKSDDKDKDDKEKEAKDGQKEK